MLRCVVTHFIFPECKRKASSILGSFQLEALPATVIPRFMQLNGGCGCHLGWARVLGLIGCVIITL